MVRLVLGADEIQLWRIDLSGEGDDLHQPSVGLLSADERERMERYRFAVHRRRFAIRRAALRTILAGYLGIDPRSVAFQYSQQGKPELAPASSGLLRQAPELVRGPELASAPGLAGTEGSATPKHARLRFNLSDSEDLALLGVTWNDAIGVDVEWIRPVAERDAIARNHFSAREYESCMRAPAEERDRVFYNCWTRKEAWLKARGEGLIGDLQAFEVSVGPGARLLSVRGEDDTPSQWRLYSRALAGGHVAAIAVERVHSRRTWMRFHGSSFPR